MQPGKSNEPTPIIRRRDQMSLAALVASALVAMACYWWYHNGHRGGLVEIDRAAPLNAAYQVNVNRADWAEFLPLPGVGETLARRLVDDRQRNGEFQSIDDLKRVAGIGEKTLERMRPYLMAIPQESEWAATETPRAESVQ